MIEDFGIKNIRGLETILTDSHCEKKIESYPKFLTADKIINFILIISDSNKFFGKVGASIIVSMESYSFLNEFVDIKKMCDKYKVKIENGGEN